MLTRRRAAAALAASRAASCISPLPEDAELVPAEAAERPNALQRALTSAASMSAEICSLLTTDLGRLPDVQRLLRERIASLEATAALMLRYLWARSESVRRSLVQLPQIRTTLQANAAQLTEEWRDMLVPLLKQGMEPAEALTHCLDNLPEVSLPSPIAAQLATLPDVRAFVQHQLHSMSELSSDLLDMIEQNIHELPDMQSLVYANVRRLPNLQHLLASCYFSSRPMLKSFEFSPRYNRDNEFILTGYRPELLTYRRCIDSLFYLHNESGNIWTHLIGGICFIFFAAYTGSYVIDQDQPWQDRLLCFLFWATAITCLLCSAIYHTVYPHSASCQVSFSKLDYSGIIALISGSVYAVIYFTFYCDANLRNFYIALTTLFGVLATFVTLDPRFDGGGKKGLRTMVFILLASTSVVPSLHFGLLYGADKFAEVVDIFWLFQVSCPLYLIGAAIFVFKVPERWFPGKFDIWLHSHQIWHVLVMSAAYAHYKCVQSMMDYRLSAGKCS